MANSFITENTAGVNYTIQNSKKVHATLSLTLIVGVAQADFEVIFPETAPDSVLLYQDISSPLPPVSITMPQTTEQSDTSITSRIVRWRTIDISGVRKLQIEVEATSLSPTSGKELWRIEIFGQVGILTNIVAGNNASITLVEADPIVEMLTHTQCIEENETAILKARVRRNTFPFLPGDCSKMVLEWSQSSDDAISANPGPTVISEETLPNPSPPPPDIFGCKGVAEVILPTLSGMITLNYIFKVIIGDFENSATFQLLQRHCFVLKWGIEGAGDGQFKYPRGITVDKDGNVYVADSGNNRIQKFDGAGNFLKKWGIEGAGDGQFKGPYGITVDKDRNVYVADAGNNRIQEFDGAGNFLKKWGIEGAGDGQFDRPYGITVDKDGNVYVAGTGNHRIQKRSSVIGSIGPRGIGSATIPTFSSWERLTKSVCPMC